MWTVSGTYDEFESGVPDPNDGQELVFDPLSWTEMACDDAAIMEQEAEILELCAARREMGLDPGQHQPARRRGGIPLRSRTRIRNSQSRQLAHMWRDMGEDEKRGSI